MAWITGFKVNWTVPLQSPPNKKHSGNVSKKWIRKSVKRCPVNNDMYDVLSRWLGSPALHSTYEEVFMSVFQIGGQVTADPKHGHQGFHTLTLLITFFGATWRTQWTKQRLIQNLHSCHIFVADQHIYNQNETTAAGNQSLLMCAENCRPSRRKLYTITEILFCILNGSVVNKHVTTQFH
jgi:hypothetical protein